MSSTDPSNPADRLGLDERRRRLQDLGRRRDLGLEERGNDRPLGPLPALRSRRARRSSPARATTSSRAPTGRRSGLRPSPGSGAHGGHGARGRPRRIRRRLYARDDFYFHSSDDGGQTWTQSKADLDVSGTTNGLFALTADPGRADTVFTSVYRQLWKSGDGGKTFVKSGNGTAARARRGDPGRSRRRRRSTPAPRARASTSRPTAARAGPRATPGMGSVNVQALLLDPAAGVIYAGTWKKGVFASKDGGKSWVNVGGEPPHPDVDRPRARPVRPRALARRNRRRERLEVGHDHRRRRAAGSRADGCRAAGRRNERGTDDRSALASSAVLGSRASRAGGTALRTSRRSGPGF